MNADAHQDPAPLERPTPRPTEQTRFGIWAFAIVGVIFILALLTWLFTGLSFFDETPDDVPAAETAHVDAMGNWDLVNGEQPRGLIPWNHG